MPSPELTESQEKVFNAIKKYWEENGFSPAYRDLMDLTGFSSPAPIQAHVDTLIAKGKITKRDGISRSIVVVKL